MEHGNPGLGRCSSDGNLDQAAETAAPDPHGVINRTINNMFMTSDRRPRPKCPESTGNLH